MKQIGGFLKKEEQEILSQADEVHKVLTHLRYEGKVSRGKNLKAANRSVANLVKTLRAHHLLQETVVFPYLLTHIPKHESLIRLLRSDHKDITRSENRLQRSIEKLRRTSTHTAEDSKAQRVGIYLICLLRHHLHLENSCIQKVIQKELRPNEKNEIAKSISKWCLKHGRGILSSDRGMSQ